MALDNLKLKNISRRDKDMIRDIKNYGVIDVAKKDTLGCRRFGHKRKHLSQIMVSESVGFRGFGGRKRL